MKGKELLIALSYIDRKYIEESEKEIPVRQPAIPEQKTKGRLMPGRKLWLIAATVALTLLLVGCAVVVYTRIRMKVVQHHVPAATAAVAGSEVPTAPETQTLRDPLTSCYPQALPARYQMGEGEQMSHHTRRIEYRNDEGKTISFHISTYEPMEITLAPPTEKINMTVSGWDALMQVKENVAQVFTWHNEKEGYYASLYTEDMGVDLQVLAESVDFGEALPLTFLCREGMVWNTWYPQQLPEGYVCRSVAPFSRSTQIINYTNMEYGITYAVSLTRDFLEEATEPPNGSFSWEDLTIAGEPARMMTTAEQRLLYWHNEQEGFYAMLMAADADVDIIALAESVAPGEPLAVSSEYLGPDYTIELEQEESAYVAWEPIYPQWLPEEYEISFVGDPAYGQQIIDYENNAGDRLTYTFYFRLGEWGRQFDGMGQPEEVTINGSLGYRLGNELIWTDEAKGFGFSLVGVPGVDLIAIAERVGTGPKLEPTNAEKTTKALAELGDYRITQLPEGMIEDGLAGMPLEDGGGWYSYVRRWYVDPNTNAQIYMEYETYTTESSIPLETMVQNFTGDRPMELQTIHGCTGAISQDESNAKVVWITGDENQGMYFALSSSDYTARELLAMAESVQKE